MNEVVNTVVDAVAKELPDSTAVQVAEAAVSTAANPSPANIVADLELALKVVKKLKAVLDQAHPSVADIVKLLF